MGHPVEQLFGLLPGRHHLTEQAPESLAVVVLGKVAKLVEDDVINALSGSFYQMRIECDPAIGRTASPLGLHIQQA